MDRLLQLIRPKPKTVVEQFAELLSTNRDIIAGTPKASLFLQAPSTMTYIKGIPLVLVGYYTIPLVVTGWMWLPWIWVAYEVYSKTELISRTYYTVKATAEYLVS